MSLTDDQIVAKNFQKFYNAILPYLNGSAHSGFTPIGTVISVMGTTAPQNYLSCDGTAYNISDYPELAAYFNQQFGSSNFFGGDGTTTFAVPDLRGEFLRGTGTNSHANQGSGANVGVHQDGTEHVGVSYGNGDGAYLAVPSNSGTYNVPKKLDSWTGATKTLKYGNLVNDESGVPLRYTSRPTNTSVLYCIASKNIFMDAGSNYSTEEQVVGTWIDGKPIYQKVISTTDLPNNSTKTIAIDSSFVVQQIFAYANNSDGAVFVIGHSGDTTLQIISHTIRLTSTYDMTGYDYTSITIILQYTKTIDA